MDSNSYKKFIVLKSLKPGKTRVLYDKIVKKMHTLEQ
jgi:hypothetical protein